MSKRCVMTGKTSRKSATRSHSNIKSLTRQKANLHRRTINGKVVWISARALKTLKKNKQSAKKAK
ncbi:50S ribosomal protein L28 [Candidatus Falkowbacteria bacterium]|nr:50S ribosomal protein L28 [Candidatus Falkowbacteria bacterium]